MEGETDEIGIEIPKCILHEILHRAFTSPDGENDTEDYDNSALQEELDNMDWDNEDNYEYMVIDNPGFINYNPEYWIPENYREFQSLFIKLFPWSEYQQARLDNFHRGILNAMRHNYMLEH